MALFDPLPDDAGHLVAVDINDWVGDLDFAESGAEVSLLVCES